MIIIMKKFYTVIFVLYVSLLFHHDVQAAPDSCTWTGLLNANWNNSGNWSGCNNGNLPENGDSLIFDSNSPNLNTHNDFASGMQFTSIIFSGDYGYTLSGNKIVLTNGSGAVTIHNSSTAIHVVNLDIDFDNTDPIIKNDGTGGEISFNNTLTLATNLALHYNYGLSVSTEHTPVNFKIITGGGGLGIDTANNIAVTIKGVANFQRDTVVNPNSILIIDNGADMPDSGYISLLNGGKVIFNTDDTIGNIGYNGIIDIGSHTIQLTSSYTFENNGEIIGSGIINTSYTLALKGNSPNFSGTINALGGDGATGADLTSFVAPQATISVDGYLLNAYDSEVKNININGTSYGILADYGNPKLYNNGNIVLQNIFTLSPGTTLQAVPTSSGFLPHYIAQGGVNINGSDLQFDINQLSYIPQPSTRFILFDKTSPGLVTGTFISKPEGTAFVIGSETMHITYHGGDGNDVIVCGTDYDNVCDSKILPTPSVATNSQSNTQQTIDNFIQRCDDISPYGKPEIYQINRNQDRAHIYFAPISNIKEYIIAYSLVYGGEDYNATFAINSNPTGALKYTINNLNPKLTYYFKVKGKNGCNVGDYGNIRKAILKPFQFYK